jgi:hypothetical protein
MLSGGCVRLLRAVSQLLWSDKDREVWFSLAEDHEKTYRLPGFPAAKYWLREAMCGFLRGKPHEVRWTHKDPQEIRVRYTPIAKLLRRQTRAEASIDDQRRAGHERGVIAGEEDGCAAYFFRLSDSS